MICRQCGHDLPEPAPMNCIYCGTQTGLNESSGTTIAGEIIEEQRYYCPWEDREQLSFIPAYWQTIKLVVTEPIKFYQNLPPRGNLWSALVYGVMTGWLGIILMMLWQIPFYFARFAIRDANNHIFPANGDIAIIFLGLFFLFFSAPILIFIGLFITAAISHFLLWLISGTKYGYEATLRLVCYAMTVHLAMVIPFCGQYIAGIWQLVLEIIGLKEVHKTNYGKAIFAKLMPIILCCCCGILLMLLLSGGIYQLMENPDKLIEFFNQFSR